MFFFKLARFSGLKRLAPVEKKKKKKKKKQKNLLFTSDFDIFCKPSIDVFCRFIQLLSFFFYLPSQTPIISRGSNFKIQPKTNFKTAEQSSANLTKVAVSDPPENETQSSSLSTEATSKLESDGNNWRDESEVKDTNKDAKNFSTTLPRRNRFQIQPKPSAKNVEQSSVANSKKTESNQSVNDIPSTCTEAEISDADSSQKTKDSENKNDDTASKDATSKM